MKRHGRENYYIVGEGIVQWDGKHSYKGRASTMESLRKFRFSRMGEQGTGLSQELNIALATAMTSGGGQPDSSGPTIPAGYTYLGQFVDHDLTMDKTAVDIGDDVTVAELVQGRSPALDLDSLYGRGPSHPEDAKFYSDAARLNTGATAATSFPDGSTNVDMDGFDLPRVGSGSKKSDRRTALIPDTRNDENLAVAQTHLMFIRFHNRVVDDTAAPSATLFEVAREKVVKHYQWMLRHDFLPRIVDPAIVDDVYANGRKVFEVPPPAAGYSYSNGNGHGNGAVEYPAQRCYSYMEILPGDFPTMPIEFSVAAFRLGHSMIRGAYQWNRVFKTGGPGPVASLGLLFTFSGTSGILSPDGDITDPESGSFERLPTNWIADFRRLYDFAEANRPDLVVTDAEFNDTKLLDTRLVEPLSTLPHGAFGARGTNPPAHEFSLAFRNLARAGMMDLATGQQMVDLMAKSGVPVTPLTEAQIVQGNGAGADLSGLTEAQRAEIAADTPLWFYVLREAELNGGRMTGVGGRIVAEVFHRAMEGSQHSIVRDPAWRPDLGPDANTFRMSDLVLYACQGNPAIVNPLGV